MLKEQGVKNYLNKEAIRYKYNDQVANVWNRLE